MHSIANATLLGGAAGLRSMTPVGVLALHGRFGGSTPLRATLVVAMAGELVADKLPATPPRTSPPALAGRLATGALVGWKAAGPLGAAVGLAAAAGTSVAGQRLRAAVVAKTDLPDPAIAVAEDALAIVLARVAARA